MQSQQQKPELLEDFYEGIRVELANLKALKVTIESEMLARGAFVRDFESIQARLKQKQLDRAPLRARLTELQKLQQSKKPESQTVNQTTLTEKAWNAAPALVKRGVGLAPTLITQTASAAMSAVDNYVISPLANAAQEAQIAKEVKEVQLKIQHEVLLEKRCKPDYDFLKAHYEQITTSVHTTVKKIVVNESANARLLTPGREISDEREPEVVSNRKKSTLVTTVISTIEVIAVNNEKPEDKTIDITVKELVTNQQPEPMQLQPAVALPSVLEKNVAPVLPVVNNEEKQEPEVKNESIGKEEKETPPEPKIEVMQPLSVLSQVRFFSYAPSPESYRLVSLLEPFVPSTTRELINAGVVTRAAEEKKQEVKPVIDYQELNRQLEEKRENDWVSHQLSMAATLGDNQVKFFLQQMQELKLWRKQQGFDTDNIDISIIQWLEYKISTLIDDKKYKNQSEIEKELVIIKTVLFSDYFDNKKNESTKLSPDLQNKLEILKLKVQHLENPSVSENKMDDYKRHEEFKNNIQDHENAIKIYRALQQILLNKNFWNSKLRYKYNFSIFENFYMPVGIGKMMSQVKNLSDANQDTIPTLESITTLLEYTKNESNIRLKTFWTCGRSNETKELYLILKEIQINALKNASYCSTLINKLDTFSKKINAVQPEAKNANLSNRNQQPLANRV